MFQGLIAATFTPFDEKGELALHAIPKYTDFLLQSGMKGLYVCGTTGEGVNMTVEERKATAAAFLEAAADRVPVVVQIGANCLEDCRELAAHAESIGAPVISANAPSYFRIDSTEILARCMTLIAQAAPKTPFYYYHIPRFTGVSIDMTEFLDRMKDQCPTFAGIKYTDTRVFQYQEALCYDHGRYDILWGCDEMLLSGLVVGGRNGVGSTYGLIPKLYIDLWSAWENNRMEQARRLQLRSWLFVKTFMSYGDSHQVQKTILKWIGFDFGASRLPIAPLADGAEKRLQAELRRLGFLDDSSPNVDSVSVRENA